MNVYVLPNQSIILVGVERVLKLYPTKRGSMRDYARHEIEKEGLAAVLATGFERGAFLIWEKYTKDIENGP